MAKRAIEEEFDRLYSEFIENPEALPRLKKRVKRCRQPATSHRRASSPSAAAAAAVPSLSSSGNAQLDGAIAADDSSSPAQEKTSSFSTLKEQVVRRNPDSPPYKLGVDLLLPNHNSPARFKNGRPVVCSGVLPSRQRNEASSDEVIDDVTNTNNNVVQAAEDTMVTVQPGEDGNHGASDIFMLHKPRLNRFHANSMQKSINPDALWAVYAKTWFRPKYAVGSQATPPAFLKRNQRQGRVCFKRYLSQQKARSSLPKSQLSSYQLEPRSANHHHPADADTKQGVAVTEAVTASGKDETNVKLANTDRDRARKRKDNKPKLHVSASQKPARAKTQAGRDALKGSRDAVTKATHLGSETPATRMKTGLQKDGAKGKQVQTRKHGWKGEEAVTKPSTAGSSKRVWTKGTTTGRQVAVCRPNAKGKTCAQDTASASKKNPAVDEDPKCQLRISESVQERPRTATDSDGFVGVETGDPGVGGGTKPLFAGQSGHCGGVWKTIVDEC